MITAKLDSQRAVLETELEIGTIYRIKSPNYIGYSRAVYMGKCKIDIHTKGIKGQHIFSFTDFKGGHLDSISKLDIANGIALIENGYSK